MFGIITTIASIPSPSRNVIELGPLSLNIYGLMIAFGVIAGVTLTQHRMNQRGMPGELAGDIAVWAVPAGVVGARLYHVATDWHRFTDNWFDIVKIWNGGLGILGGIIAGTAVGVWRVHKHGLPVLKMLNAAAPGLPLAQAIGRWGNWFNQELFGRPTDLPWALEIDEAHVQHLGPDFAGESLFHPTFLYESLWNFALVGVLLWIDKRRPVKPGRLMLLYLGGYAVGRLWIEAIRIDSATRVFDVRINLWIFGLVLAATVLALIKLGIFGTESEIVGEAADDDTKAEAEDVDAEDADDATEDSDSDEEESAGDDALAGSDGG